MFLNKIINITNKNIRINVSITYLKHKRYKGFLTK